MAQPAADTLCWERLAAETRGDPALGPKVETCVAQAWWRMMFVALFAGLYVVITTPLGLMTLCFLFTLNDPLTIQ